MNKSHITMILDRSYSMITVAPAVVEAVNAFFVKQRTVDDICDADIVQFDDVNPYELVYRGPLAGARLDPDKYTPRGNTPLWDAVGKGIVDLGERLAALPEADRPGQVIFVIQTDGQENSSKEWDSKKLADAIKRQHEQYNWQFVFLGANQDAILAGGELGIGRGTSLSNKHTSKSYASAMGSSASNIAAYRSMKTSAGISGYTEEQRAAALED